MKLLDILFERKQVGLLYHYTGQEALNRIKGCNCLKAGFVPDPSKVHVRQATRRPAQEKNISVTRNKNLHKLDYFVSAGFGIPKYSDSNIYRLTLDGNLLSDYYKIEPYNFFIDKYHTSHHTDEYEERIITPEITDLDKFLISIDDVTHQVNFNPLKRDKNGVVIK